MRKTQKGAAIIGFLAGAMLGAVVGFGGARVIKKAHRQLRIIPIVCVSAVIAGMGGAAAGLKIERKIYIDKTLGISSATDEVYKTGRFWIASTKWFDNTTQKENKLYTGRNA